VSARQAHDEQKDGKESRKGGAFARVRARQMGDGFLVVAVAKKSRHGSFGSVRNARGLVILLRSDPSLGRTQSHAVRRTVQRFTRRGESMARTQAKKKATELQCESGFNPDRNFCRAREGSPNPSPAVVSHSAFIVFVCVCLVSNARGLGAGATSA
jgi:hypothetical protein